MSYIDGAEEFKTFATKIIKHFIADLNNLKINNTKKVDIGQSLVANPCGSKLIKNILLLQENFIDKYCQQLSEIFKNNLEKVLHSNASFVLTILIEKGRT